MNENARLTSGKTAFAAVAIFVATVGAISGQAIGQMPILRESAGGSIPEALYTPTSFAEVASGERPPDHYPLVTPDGTVPVAELALRGRLRDREEAWYAMSGSFDHPADYQPDFSDGEIEHLAYAEPVETGNDPYPHDKPQASDQPAAKVTHSTQAKVIDISAQLQAQDEL